MGEATLGRFRMFSVDLKLVESSFSRLGSLNGKLRLIFSSSTVIVCQAIDDLTIEVANLAQFRSLGNVFNCELRSNPIPKEMSETHHAIREQQKSSPRWPRLTSD